MEEQLKIDFDKVIKNLKSSKKDVELREKNLNEFIKNGFPNKRIEDWKFSDLKSIIDSNFDEDTSDHVEDLIDFEKLPKPTPGNKN